MGLDKSKILVQTSNVLIKINNPNHPMTVAYKRKNRTMCVFLLIGDSCDNAVHSKKGIRATGWTGILRDHMRLSWTCPERTSQIKAQASAL